MQTGTNKKAERNEIEAMYVIINIQQMQKCIYGKSFAYDDFRGNSIGELYHLQETLLPLYNEWAMSNK